MRARRRGAGLALVLVAALAGAPLAALDGRLETLAVTLPRSPDAPPPGAVRALLVSRDGFLWIATDGGLARYDGSRFRRFDPASEPPWAAGAATALAETGAGALWIGTLRGPRVWDGAAFAAPLPGAAGAVTALAAGPDGAVWIGAPRGLARWAGGAVRWFGPADGLPAAGITDLALDAAGGVWAATAAGVARLEGERFRALSSQPARALAAAGDGVVALVEGAGGETVVELPGGRVLVRGRAGAPGALARRLLVDRAGDLWLGGFELARQRAASPFVDFDGSGRLGRDITALAQGRDGRLWVGTATGEVRGLGAAAPGAAPAPTAVLDALIADGRALPLARARTPPGAGRLELAFTAAAFDRPAALRFRYRLVGYERDWQGPTGERRAVYTRPPPRAYRFEVAATLDGEHWSAPAALALEVAPRWFETVAARAAAALLAVLALVAADRLRLHRLRRREHELRHLVAVSTAELRTINATLEQRVAAQTGEIRATRDMAVLTLARLAELRDGTTGEHLERIASYARRLAEAVAASSRGPLAPEFVDEIYRSSPLHDIGKVAIPDAILRKAGPLDREERRLMEAHTTVGGDTLRQVIERSPAHSFLSMAMEIAYHHHERWDGGGYPAGLAGEAIALPARIVAVVDAYDALTSARSYKPALPHEEAVRRIVADAGRHFDPRLVGIFQAIAAEIDAIRGAHPSAAAG